MPDDRQIVGEHDPGWRVLRYIMPEE